jgi:hypothetical protein
LPGEGDHVEDSPPAPGSERPAAQGDKEKKPPAEGGKGKDKPAGKGSDVKGAPADRPKAVRAKPLQNAARGEVLIFLKYLPDRSGIVAFLAVPKTRRGDEVTYELIARSCDLRSNRVGRDRVIVPEPPGITPMMFAVGGPVVDMFLTHPQLSPDGKRLAWMTPMDGKLWVADLMKDSKSLAVQAHRKKGTDVIMPSAEVLFSSCGKAIVTRSTTDDMIRFWDPVTLKQIGAQVAGSKVVASRRFALLDYDHETRTLLVGPPLPLVLS